jgi:hypothetical protein
LEETDRPGERKQAERINLKFYADDAGLSGVL